LHLSEKSEIDLDEDTSIFIGILMKYQLEGRYPDYQPFIPESAKVEEYLDKTKKLLLCLKLKL